MLIAIPAIGNLWARAMSRWRLCGCCIDSDNEADDNSSEGNGLQLQDMGGPRRHSIETEDDDSDSNDINGSTILLLLFVPAANKESSRLGCK